MADKLQQGVNVLTTFADGETPTAAKLNSIAAQLRNASQQLEKAVGDIHDQSYPYSSATAARLSLAYGRVNATTALTNAATRSLDIVNLARLIGPSSNLNPELLGGSRELTEPVPASVHEFSLKYPPESAAAVTFSKNGTGEPFETYQPLVSSLTAEGHFHVDVEGRVFSTMVTDSIDPGTVTYTTDSDSYKGGSTYMGSQFNVLPDLNQLSAGGAGCAIGAPDAQGRRQVTLPLATHAQFDHDMSSIVLDDADALYQEQLLLPQVIVESYTVGEIIPAGFLLLKNWTTGEVYDVAEYTYNGTTSVLIGVTDITTEVDRGDVFALVTVGTDITTSIDDLRRKMRHGHDRSFGEPMVPAASITDWTAGPWGAPGSFTVSNIEGNYAPQYLHRYGYYAGENNWNDDNAMRGDFLMGEASNQPGAGVSASGSAPVVDTHKIAWGHPDNAYAYLNTSSQLWIENTLSGGIRMVTNAGGLWQSVGSYTLRIDPDTLANRSYSAKVSTISKSLGDGFYQVSAGGLTFNYQEDSDVSNVSTLHSDTETADPDDRQVYFRTNSTNSECPILFEQLDATAEGILELSVENSSTPGSDFNYLKMTERVGSGAVTVMGSIRSSTSSSEGAFYSWHSSNYEYAEIASDSTSGNATTRVTTQDAGHVKYVSGGADYGEWVRAGDHTEWEPYFKEQERPVGRLGLPEGLVVFVREGRFWAQGEGTPMVITNRAIVVGNEKLSTGPLSECEVLSFIGQVPVMALGAIRDGDYLIPNPDEPGTVIGIVPSDVTFAQYRAAVGTAWQSYDYEGLKLVMCAIGKK